MTYSYGSQALNQNNGIQPKGCTTQKKNTVMNTEHTFKKLITILAGFSLINNSAYLN